VLKEADEIEKWRKYVIEHAKPQRPEAEYLMLFYQEISRGYSPEFAAFYALYEWDI
jgi:hypothetical protein